MRNEKLKREQKKNTRTIFLHEFYIKEFKWCGNNIFLDKTIFISICFKVPGPHQAIYSLGEKKVSSGYSPRSSSLGVKLIETVPPLECTLYLLTMHLHTLHTHTIYINVTETNKSC